MRNWDSTDEKGESVCTLTQDRSDALEVCKKLNIPFHEVIFYLYIYLFYFNFFQILY